MRNLLNKLLKSWRLYWRRKECIRLAQKILINSHAAIPTYTEVYGQQHMDNYGTLPNQALCVANHFLRNKYGDVNDDFDMNYMPKQRSYLDGR